VPARIFATEKLVRPWTPGSSPGANVACLPGIINYAYCMPDGHWVTASPSAASPPWTRRRGDLPRRHRLRHQLRMRLLRTNLTEEEVRPGSTNWWTTSSTASPPGSAAPASSGSPGMSSAKFWSRAPLGRPQGIRLARGPGADRGRGLLQRRRCRHGKPQGIERGFDQIGTLGSGNHYCEVQVARPENVFDEGLARPSASTGPTRWWSCSTAAAGASVTRWPPTTCRPSWV